MRQSRRGNQGKYAMFASFDFSRQFAGLASVVIAVTCIVAAVGPAVAVSIA
jgi:hypothetical protein